MSQSWTVLKFGGTSLGKYCRQIAETIIAPREKSSRLALVCSARSSSKKKTGTTSRLLDILDLAIESHPECLEAVDLLEADHLAAAANDVSSITTLEKASKSIVREFEILRDVLKAANVLQEISAKTRDTVVGLGERLSCLIFTAVLEDFGIGAQYVPLDHIVPHETGTILRDGNHIALDHQFYELLSKQIAEKIRDCGDKIPVITGFFGVVPGGLLDQIGRGYTDLCAAFVAIGLSASELQIWKEVDGIFTADPSKVPTARLLAKITPEEAAELTYFGSEVIHPFTMEQVIREHIPIRIMNVLNPGTHGTVIFPEDSFVLRSNNFDTQPIVKMPTAVTVKDNIIVINVQSNRKLPSYIFLMRVFQCLEKHKIAVDLISTSEVNVSMAIHASHQTRQILRMRAELEKFSHVSSSKNMAILSVVGKEMRRLIGVAGKMFTTLAAASINLEMISQGANEINISCVISEVDAIKAMSVVHHELLSRACLSRANSGMPLYDSPAPLWDSSATHSEASSPLSSRNAIF